MEIVPAQFDATALSRHDGPGPRYTSYPPAPGDAAAPDDRPRQRRAHPRQLSLYVHVPFCQSPCFREVIQLQRDKVRTTDIAVHVPALHAALG